MRELFEDKDQELESLQVRRPARLVLTFIRRQAGGVVAARRPGGHLMCGVSAPIGLRRGRSNGREGFRQTISLPFVPTGSEKQ